MSLPVTFQSWFQHNHLKFDLMETVSLHLMFAESDLQPCCCLLKNLFLKRQACLVHLKSRNLPCLPLFHCREHMPAKTLSASTNLGGLCCLTCMFPSHKVMEQNYRIFKVGKELQNHGVQPLKTLEPNSPQFRDI